MRALPDVLLVSLGSLVVAVALAHGTTVGRRAAAASAPPGFLAAGPRTPDVPGPRARTGRLPEGVSIDPETLEITGLDLAGETGTSPLDWATLKAYEYREGLAGIPEEIRRLDGTRVAMAGFLLPLYEWEDIREFNLVASHWSCCFGVPPGITGWVQVRLATGQGGLPNTTDPLKVTGTFRIREAREAGYVVSIWALEDATATVVGW